MLNLKALYPEISNEDIEIVNKALAMWYVEKALDNMLKVLYNEDGID